MCARSRAFSPYNKPAHKCGGSGEAIQQPCAHCHGEGREQTHQKLDVNIPPGVEHGTQLKLKGRGDAPPRPGSNPSLAQRGDLYLVITVAPHRFFKQDGAHLYCQLTIPFTTAALGGESTIPSLLTGETLQITIPPGTQNGQQPPPLQKRFAARRAARALARAPLCADPCGHPHPTEHQTKGAPPKLCSRLKRAAVPSVLVALHVVPEDLPRLVSRMSAHKSTP